MAEIYESIFQVNPEFMCSYITYKGLPYNLRNRSSLIFLESVLRIMVQNAVHFRETLIRNCRIVFLIYASLNFPELITWRS